MLAFDEEIFRRMVPFIRMPNGGFAFQWSAAEIFLVDDTCYEGAVPLDAPKTLVTHMLCRAPQAPIGFRNMAIWLIEDVIVFRCSHSEDRRIVPPLHKLLSVPTKAVLHAEDEVLAFGEFRRLQGHEYCAMTLAYNLLRMSHDDVTELDCAYLWRDYLLSL